MKTILLLFALLASALASRYPLFKQCDHRWGNDIMVTTTICKVGCLMSSTAMGLNGHNISIPNNGSANPGTFNEWLRENHGYDSHNDFIEEAATKLSPRIKWLGKFVPQTAISIDKAREYIDSDDKVLIANVRDGRHFVLCVGYDEANKDVFHVNDPGFDVTHYSYKNDIVGWRLFGM